MRFHGVDGAGHRFDLSPADGTWQPGSGSDVVDLTGLHVLSGLVDAHAHLSADTLDVEAQGLPEQILGRAAVALRRGVLDIVDKGWSDDGVLDLVATGRLAHPRVQASGQMIHPHDGYWADFGRVVDGDHLVAVCGEMGSTRPWVKVVGDWPRKGRGALPNYEEAVLRDAVAAAHEGGARVAVHTMAPDVASMAVRAGVDSIEHGLFLTTEDLEMLAARSGVWVPTVLRMHEVLAEMRPGSSGAEVLGRGLENVQALLPTAAELGVAVLAGSDLAIAVGDIGLEVRALIALGFPAEAAVAGASDQARAALGGHAGFAVGGPADLVAYAGDPRDDPDLLLTPMLVVSSGEVVVDER
jgi:imidazolonepropionase-like amidohydrolase